MELSALGTETRNNQDIFKHCRQFERAFQTMLNEANVAFKIRAVVEGHLPEMLYKFQLKRGLIRITRGRFVGKRMGISLILYLQKRELRGLWWRQCG